MESLSRWHSAAGVSTQPWDSGWPWLWARFEQAVLPKELLLGGRQGWELRSTAGENLLHPGALLFVLHFKAAPRFSPKT